MTIIEIKSAYLSSIGKTSPEYKFMNYFFVFFDVLIQQHLVSQSLLKHLRNDYRKTYKIGKKILKHKVKVITTPIL